MDNAAMRISAVALAFLALSLTVMVACALSGGRDSGPGQGRYEGGTIELPKPEPFPGPGGGDAPPPAWLIAGTGVVQGSYGVFCDLDVCTDAILFGERTGDVAAAEVSAGDEVLVAVGSGRIEEFDAGWKGWDYEGGETTMAPGAFEEAGEPSSGLRTLEARRKPSSEKPIVELPGAKRGGLTVFELRSTGGPGERLLYVTVREEDEQAAKTPARERFGFDWASYRWHLKPD